MVARIGAGDIHLTNTLFQIGISLLVAVVTALLTVWLSLHRFYREKWWEAKMRAYSDLIHALHNMKRDLEITIRAVMVGRDTDTPFYKEWAAKHRAAWDEIRKDIDVGEFLFSAASIKVLKTLDRETESGPDDDYFSNLEKLQAGVEKCPPAIQGNGPR
jgi:hypothetical protein